MEEGRISADLEFDAHDQSSRHVLGLLGDAPVLCARWRIEHEAEGGEDDSGRENDNRSSVAVIDRLAVLGSYRGRGFSSTALKFLVGDVESMAREMQPQGLAIAAVAVTLPAELVSYVGEKLMSKGGFELRGGAYNNEQGQSVLRMVRRLSS